MSLEELDWKVVWGGGVLLCAATVALYLQLRLRRAQRERAERLENIRRFDAVRTASPLPDPAGEARARSLQALETRFALFRRALVPGVLLAFLTVAALPFLSQVPATLITLLAGVASVVVGVAAKPFVENLIAGVAISLSQPLRIGDTVKIDEHYGTVEDISTTHVTIKVWDWRRYQIPNARLFDKSFVNYSIVDRFQWAYVEFWVSYGSDLAQVQRLAVRAVSSSTAFSGHEDPRFWVMEMDREGLRCWVAGWADTPSAAWTLCHDARVALQRSFRKHGIETHGHTVRVKGEPPPGPQPPPLVAIPPPPGVLHQDAAALEDDGEEEQPPERDATPRGASPPRAEEPAPRPGRADLE